MMTIERRGDDVSILRLDDGKVNAIGPGFLHEFERAWAEAATGGRAIVVTGNAKVFCAGLDLKGLSGLTQAQVAGFARDFIRAFRIPMEHPRPVVAAVNGPAIAGGAVLALACDWRVAAHEARMGVTEVPVGVPFPRPVLELVRARLPAQEHPAALLDGAVREGAALAQSGWAQEVVPRAEVVDRAVEVAQRLAARSPLAFTRGKRDVNAPALTHWHPFEDGGGALAWATDLFAVETQTALRATLAKLTR